VRSHLHWIYIDVTIFVGLFLSYFLKVHLQQRIELDQANLDARKLYERVVEEEAKHVDPDFRNAYNAAKEALKIALVHDDAADINAKKTDMEAKWR
jgi:hypothetical protein